MVVALLLVHGIDLRHLLVGKGKIEQVQIGLDVVRVLGAGDDDVADLDVPAEDDLSVALAVLLGKLREQGLLLKRLVPVAQGIPGLDDNALVGQEGLQLFSWE